MPSTKIVLVPIGNIAALEVPVGTLAGEVDAKIRKQFPLIQGGGLDYVDDYQPICMLHEESFQLGDEVMFRRLRINEKNVDKTKPSSTAPLSDVLLHIEGIDTVSVPIGASTKLIVEAIKRDYPQLIGGVLLDYDGLNLSDLDASVKLYDELFFTKFTMKWRGKENDYVPLSIRPRPVDGRYLKDMNRSLAMINFLQKRLGLIPSQVSSNSYTFLLHSW